MQKGNFLISSSLPSSLPQHRRSPEFFAVKIEAGIKINCSRIENIVKKELLDSSRKQSKEFLSFSDFQPSILLALFFSLLLSSLSLRQSIHSLILNHPKMASASQFNPTSSSQSSIAASSASASPLKSQSSMNSSTANSNPSNSNSNSIQEEKYIPLSWLEGMPISLLQALRQSAISISTSGIKELVIPLDSESWETQTILKYSSNEKAREKAYLISNSNGNPMELEKVKVLESLLKRRAELAKVTGNDGSYSRMTLGDKMAKRPGE